MNKLLNYKTKTKNATPPIFTEIVALFFFTNCQRWDYDLKKQICPNKSTLKNLSIKIKKPVDKTASL